MNTVCKFGQYSVVTSDYSTWYVFQGGRELAKPHLTKSSAVELAKKLAKEDAMNGVSSKPAGTPPALVNATYGRLPNGDWGVIVWGRNSEPLEPGTEVTVTRRDGVKKVERVAVVELDSESLDIRKYSIFNAVPSKEDDTPKFKNTFAELWALFEVTTDKLKQPKLFLTLPTGEELKITKSKKYKSLWVYVKHDSWGYRGYLNENGKYTQKIELDAELVASVLKELETDPLRKASEWGKLSGRCCFCNRQLKDTRSKEVGYGKDCADHRGLVWGVAKGECEIKSIVRQIDDMAKDEVDWRPTETVAEDYYTM